MSTLGAQLRESGRNHIMLPLRFDIRQTVSDMPITSVRVEIMAKLAASCVLHDHMPPEERARAINNTKRTIMRAVMGEYRTPLLDAIHALHDHDVNRARQTLERIVENMDNFTPMREQK